jgi:Variant SH3 domain/Fes/CIP4, and EFC/F-BAR homology domain
MLKSCVEMSGFFKKLSMLEAQYAKDLAKLARRYKASKAAAVEVGSLRACWDLILNELESKATKHLEFSTHLSNEVSAPVVQFAKEKDGARKKLVREGMKLTKEYNDVLAALAKAKGTYEARCKEADAATGQYQKAKAEGSIKPKELNKLNAKSAKATDAAMTANSEYRKYLKRANVKQGKFYDKEMPKLLSDFQEFEEDRIRFMKTNFARYAGFESEFPPFSERSAKGLVETSENVDIKKDIETFLAANKTGQSAPGEIPYEAYNPTNPNQDFGASAVASGSDSSAGASSAGGGAASSSSPSVSAPNAPPKSSSKSSSKSGGSAVASAGGAGTPRDASEFGLSGADSSLSPEAKRAKLQGQLDELRSQIKDQVKSKKGLEKLVKFYASDPVAQDKASKELDDQKKKIQGMKDTAADLERQIGELDGGASAAPAAAPAAAGRGPPPLVARNADAPPAAAAAPQAEATYEEPPAAYDEGAYGADDSAAAGGYDEGEADYEEPYEEAEIIYATALYDYEATNDTELSFPEGAQLVITEQDESGWWYAEYTDETGSLREGFCPSNFVSVTPA